MWHRSVRATNDEQTCALPGDDLIQDAIGSLTHAVTIHRPPLDVWPWLAQMGAGARAGWYSYDWMIRLGHFVMQRRQLLGIAQRTESLAPGPDSREGGVT